jgi:hypothetical protein
MNRTQDDSAPASTGAESSRCHGPRTYEFRIAGHLDDHWSAWFPNLAIARRDDGTSTLTGVVSDQAQLHGILALLRDIGAPLLSLRSLEGL